MRLAGGSHRWLCGRYLELPVEVLASTLKVHQRYFPVLGKAGNPTTHFITVANIDSTMPAEVQRGNERVIAPRLSDAAFFWQNDQRTSLADRAARLDTIVYQKALGSIADKAARTGVLAIGIAEGLGVDAASVTRAALLARCDLVTEMVGEFRSCRASWGVTTRRWTVNRKRSSRPFGINTARHLQAIAFRQC